MNKHVLVYIIICSAIYVGYGQPGNPDYLNTLKNIFVSTHPDMLRAASRQAAALMIQDISQAMEGKTESDALKTLSRDRLLQNICESMYKMYMGPSEEAAIGVYDECEHWLNPLIRQCWNSQYTMVRRTLKQVPTYDDGVLSFVKEQQVFPLVAHIIRELSTENLGVELHPKVHQYKQYLDVLVPYVDRVAELYRKRYVGVGDELLSVIDESNPFGMNRHSDMDGFFDMNNPFCLDDSADVDNPFGFSNPFGMNDADDMPPVDVELCCHVYCALDACQRAIRGERMYHNVIPIVNFLDYLQLALLHFYVETDNRVGYERYIETVYPPLFSMRFDWISQMHVLLNENGHEAEDEYTQGNHYWNYTNAVFLLWVKAVWHFHLDHMDQASWDELGTLWDATYDNPNYQRHTQDHYAYLECVKYMVKLAVHFGDTRRAELYKRNLQTLIDEEYRFGWAGTALGYPWNASDYCIMAQINESLGKLDLAKEQYDKALPW